MTVVLCEKDGVSIVGKIKSEKPDVVLADVFMPNLDILGVLQNIKDMSDKDKPLVMVFSSFDNSQLEAEILKDRPMRGGRVLPVEADDFKTKSAIYLPEKARYDYGAL